MKKKILIILFLISIPQFIWSQFELTDKKIYNPQLGFWFGPITPIWGTDLQRILKTSLGGGIYLRVNFPTNDWRFEAGASYDHYLSNTLERLTTWPTYFAVSYKIPIPLQLSFYLKLGSGFSYVSNQPEGHNNYLPLLFVGWETTFPIGKWVGIGIRLDYYYLIERHLKAPPGVTNFKVVDGHFFNFGLTLYVNTNPI